jgi:hypothetical protein
MAGEIDLANARALLGTIPWGVDTRVVVDLSGVNFIDSSGIAEMVRLSRARPLSVVAPSLATSKRFPSAGARGRLSALSPVPSRLRTTRG